MQITRISGTISASTTQPKFEDEFKGFINPFNAIAHDDLREGEGVLTGRQIGLKGNSKIWQKKGYSEFSVSPSGSASILSSLPTLQTVSHATSGEIFASFELGSSLSYIALAFRALDRINCVLFSMGQSLNGFALQSFNGGTYATISVAPKTLLLNKVYNLKVSFTETSILCYADGDLIFDIQNSTLASNIGVGVISSDTAHKLWEFVVL